MTEVMERAVYGDHRQLSGSVVGVIAILSRRNEVMERQYGFKSLESWGSQGMDQREFLEMRAFLCGGLCLPLCWGRRLAKECRLEET